MSQCKKCGSTVFSDSEQLCIFHCKKDSRTIWQKNGKWNEHLIQRFWDELFIASRWNPISDLNDYVFPPISPLYPQSIDFFERINDKEKARGNSY